MTLAGFGPGEAYSLACAACWGVAVILFKRSGEQLAPGPLGLVKNLLALALLLPTALAFAGPFAIGGQDLALALVSGFLGIAVGDTLYFQALNRIGAARVAAAQTLYSPFVIVLSLQFLGERLGAAQWLGVGVILAGIALVTWERAGRRPPGLAAGLAAAMLAVLAMAVGIVMAKPLLAQQDFLWLVTLRVLGGVLGLLASLALPGQARALLPALRAVHDWRPILSGAFLGTYLSMLLWLAGYKYTQASIAAVLNEMAAVFIVVLAALWLREPVRLRQALGILLALAGVVAVILVPAQA